MFSDKDKLQAIISEYQALREEINRRTRYQMYCITVSVIGVGTLIGVIAGSPIAFSPILLVIPWLLSVFGIIWSDHSHGIHLIGLYIRNEIEGKKLPMLFGSSDIRWIGWESYMHERRGKTPLVGYIITVLPLCYFFLPSVASLVAYYFLRIQGVAAMPKAIEWFFIAVGVILMIALTYSWYRAYKAYTMTRIIKQERNEISNP